MSIRFYPSSLASRGQLLFCLLCGRLKYPARLYKRADWLTQSYSLCLALSNAFGVFLLPFMGKFIQLIKSATDSLYALGQTISHGRRDRRLLSYVELI